MTWPRRVQGGQKDATAVGLMMTSIHVDGLSLMMMMMKMMMD